MQFWPGICSRRPASLLRAFDANDAPTGFHGETREGALFLLAEDVPGVSVTAIITVRGRVLTREYVARITSILLEGNFQRHHANLFSTTISVHRLPKMR